MSGHSKWSTIKRQKGVNDAKRGLTFTKLSNAISISVRQGGNIGDPNQNFRLRLAVEAARAANMPKENIARAIERALSKQSGAFEETIYEGFAPGNVAVIVEAATDNKNRTTAEVKNVFEKNGGTMGQMGSVAYNFKRVGRLLVERKGMSYDDAFLAFADLGAEDVMEHDDDTFAIIVGIPEMTHVKDALLNAGHTITEMGMVFLPVTTVEVDEETMEKVARLVERLEDLDDVQQVFVNLA